MADVQRSAVTDSVSPFTLAIPIVKVDKEKRLVRGVATAEVLDAQGDVVDYDTAKAAFALWRGNVREMHQPKAVGKRTNISFDDTNRQIIVESYISKGAPDTWEKVCDGTLGMYSIGGSGERRPMKVGDADANKLFLKSLTELSLVDNGACPAATFEIVKTIDGTPTDVQPAEDRELTGHPDVITSAYDAAVREFGQAVAQKMQADLEAAIVADATKRDIPQSERDDMPASDFAGEGTSFPIKKPEDVEAAVRDLGRTNQDRAKVKARIIAIARRKGKAFIDQLPEAWKKDDEKAQKYYEGALVSSGPGGGPSGFRAEPWDIDRALQTLSLLEQLLVSEALEAASGEATAKAQVQTIRYAIELVLAFVRSEFDEQFDDGDDDGAVELAVASGNVAKAAHAYLGVTTMSNETLSKAHGFFKTVQAIHDLTGDLGALHVGKDDAETGGNDDADLGQDVVAAQGASNVKKAGARHSKADFAKIQQIHDHTVKSMGAVCKDDGGDAGGGGDTSMGGDATDVSMAAQAGEVQKLLDSLTELKTTNQAQADQVAQLTKRLETLEKQPASGGPMARVAPGTTVVEKDAAKMQADPQALIVELQKLAAETTDERQKDLIATRIYELQRKSGIGARVVSQYDDNSR